MIEKLLNKQVLRYVLKNPLKLFNEKYDSVIENALYGDAIDIVQGKNCKITMADNFFEEHNIIYDKEKIVIPIQPDFLCCSILFA